MSIQDVKSEIESIFPTKQDAYIKLDDSLGKRLPDITEEQRVSLFRAITQFAHYFDMFKDLQYFFEEIYDAIVSAIDLIDPEAPLDVKEFDELLQKTVLLRFVEAYVTHAQLGQKEKILDILSTSLGILAPQALFLNLGLMVKPIYTSEEYVKQKKAQEVTEISYDEYRVGVEAEGVIKQGVDRWLKSQKLDLEKQDEFKEALRAEFNRLCSENGVAEGSAVYDKLLSQVNEMFVMQLTLLSLGGFGDEEEDLAPVPIT
ncbi:MAG: hypothetical protein ACTSU5_01080 [Promethearchaeota archaeon]